jgi:hypothetical protein
MFNNAGGGRNIGFDYKGRSIGIAHTGAVRALNALNGREPIEEDEAKANARLIAAAPDMLEALKGILASFHKSVTTTESLAEFPALQAVAQAITKAETGELTQ